MGKNNKKFTQKQAYDMFKSYGFIMLEEYINNGTRITCKNINDEYKYSIRLDALKNGDKPSLWGLSNERNFDYNIALWLKNNAPTIQYLGYKPIIKGNKKQTLIYLKCECGNDFTVVLTKMVNGYYKIIKCDKCKAEKHKIYGIKKSTQQHLDIIKNSGYTIIDEDVYLHKTINCTDTVDVIDKDGYKGVVSSNLCNKAKHFSKFAPRINKKYFLDNANLYYKQNNIECECCGSDGNLLKVRCKCGEEFTIEPKQIRYRTRCIECSRKLSVLEEKVALYLQEKNIPFKREYRFKDCKDYFCLPFDFFIQDKNVCIETDGEQHYKYKDYFGTIEDFNLIQKHDKIKNDYCKNNNIQLIRIPYYEFENDNWKNYLKDLV